MSVLSAPVAVLATVVAFAACAKLHDPSTTTGALRANGIPAGDAVVRFGAMLEFVVAASVLVTGARVALAALAASYAGFTVFVVVALRRDRPLATCGCVGRADSPPSRVHVALDALAAAVVATAAVRGVDAPVRILTSVTPMEAITFAVLVVLGTGLFLASITVLPVVLALRAPTRT